MAGSKGQKGDKGRNGKDGERVSELDQRVMSLHMRILS